MPPVTRAIADGGAERAARRHLWRGGHDPATVKSALEIRLVPVSSAAAAEHGAGLTLTNVGAAHYLPTGTPDRHLTVSLRVLDASGRTLVEQHHTLKRTVMWRPFIVDLWDTRLSRWQPRTFEITLPRNDRQQPAAVEAVVRYHLLDEKRRRRIGYENSEPIAYEVFRQRLAIP